MDENIPEVWTPVVEVWDKVLLLSIVGVLDSERAKTMIEILLQTIVDKESRVVIIDLNGVHLMDTEVAKHIIYTIKAVKLMGPDVIISGIKTDVAQTMVSLNITFEVETYNILSRALERALKIEGWKISRD